jgi:hypothetical protein
VQDSNSPAQGVFFATVVPPVAPRFVHVRSTSVGPVAAAVIKLESDHGPVCASRLLTTPHVCTEIARGVIFGDQPNKPGVRPRRRLSLNLLRPLECPPHPPTRGFALHESNRLVRFQAGARSVIRSWPHLLASDCCHQAEDRYGGNEASNEASHVRQVLGQRRRVVNLDLIGQHV